MTVKLQLVIEALAVSSSISTWTEDRAADALDKGGQM
jgi:hypothetical protein